MMFSLKSGSFRYSIMFLFDYNSSKHISTKKRMNFMYIKSRKDLYFGFLLCVF